MMDKTIKGICNLFKPLAILLIVSLAVLNMSSTLMHVGAQSPIMTTFYIDPEISSGTIGEIITLDINVSNAADLWGWQVEWLWDPAVLGYLGYTYGTFMAGQPELTQRSVIVDWVDMGYFLCTELTIGKYPGKSGDGWLISVDFEVLAFTDITIDIDSLSTYWLDSTMDCFGDEPDEMIKENGYFRPAWTEICDINDDGFIDIFDLVLVAINFGKTTDINPPGADVDGNGVVDIYDLTLVAYYYGEYV